MDIALTASSGSSYSNAKSDVLKPHSMVYPVTSAITASDAILNMKAEYNETIDPYMV